MFEKELTRERAFLYNAVKRTDVQGGACHDLSAAFEKQKKILLPVGPSGIHHRPAVLSDIRRSLHHTGDTDRIAGCVFRRHPLGHRNGILHKRRHPQLYRGCDENQPIGRWHHLFRTEPVAASEVNGNGQCRILYFWTEPVAASEAYGNGQCRGIVMEGAISYEMAFFNKRK